ncbi:MAG: hypothetical protein SO253_02540 [Bacilli bacterium]|nr:hypothetical protein [Bacilli bacterium]
MYQNEIKKLSKYDNIIAVLRFIIFTLIVISLFFLKYHFFYLITIFFTISFVMLIIIHDKVINKLRFYQAILEIYQEIEQKKNLEFTYIKTDFKSNDLAKDLDLDYLFSLINCGYTYKGKKILFEHLTEPKFSDSEIINRQQAVKEMFEKHNVFNKKFQAYSKMKKSRKISYNFENYLFKEKNKYQDIYLLLLLIGFIDILGIIFNIFPWWSILILFIFNYLVKNKQKQELDEYLTALDSLSLTFETYNNLASLINTEKFECEYLVSLKEQLLKGQIAFKKLIFINNLANFVKNPFTDFIFSGFFALVGNVYTLFIKWGKKYKNDLYQSIDAIAAIEEIISLTTINEVFPSSTPTLINKTKIAFTNLSHPLIKNYVSNDVNFSKNSVVITGSNMSGKTTYLRSIGINLVLALNGANILASSGQFTNIKIFTSMRVHDDVNKGISTFYAEIKRIKSMIEYSKTNQPMICLIDEIFKGTNSLDRIKGATEGINKLTKDNVIIIVSTHDFELCNLDNIVNYHFEEYYENDEIHFTYKLQDDRCKTSNAIFLMKLAGIID